MSDGPTPRFDRDVMRRFDRRAPSYDAQSLWVNDAEIVSELLAGVDAGTRLLEAAGGTGAVSAVANERGAWTVCCDLSMGMLTQALGKGLRVVRADMHFLPFPDRAFDKLVIRQGLQYADLATAFPEFRRVAAHEVGAAQIVAANEADHKLWLQLFSALGQTDRVVFLAGAIEAAAAAAGLRLTATTTLRRTERLISPNVFDDEHRMDSARIEDLVRQIDPKATREGSDWLHEVQWEILHFATA